MSLGFPSPLGSALQNQQQVYAAQNAAAAQYNNISSTASMLGMDMAQQQFQELAAYQNYMARAQNAYVNTRPYVPRRYKSQWQKWLQRATILTVRISRDPSMPLEPMTVKESRRFVIATLALLVVSALSVVRTALL